MSDATGGFTVRASKFANLVRESAIKETGSAGDDPWVHSEIYLRCDGDSVDVLVSAGGNSVVTYNTYEEDFFDSLTGEFEGILKVERTLDYLDAATDGGRTEFQFNGESLANTFEAHGALNFKLGLAGSQKVVEENVPIDFPERWNDENRVLSPSGNPHKTTIDTSIEEVGRIVRAVSLHDNLDYFPVSVEDGDFVLNVEDEQSSDEMWGELEGEVDGEDLTNWYATGFEGLFTTLQGDVQLQTTPGNFPMAVVQEKPNRTIRNLIVEVNPA